MTRKVAPRGTCMLCHISYCTFSCQIALCLIAVLASGEIVEQVGVQNLRLDIHIDEQTLLRCRHHLLTAGLEQIELQSEGVINNPQSQLKRRNSTGHARQLKQQGRQQHRQRHHHQQQQHAEQQRIKTSIAKTRPDVAGEFFSRYDCIQALIRMSTETSDVVTSITERYAQFTRSISDFTMVLRLAKPRELHQFQTLQQVIACYDYLCNSPSVGGNIRTDLVKEFLAIINLIRVRITEIQDRMKELQLHSVKYISADVIGQCYYHVRELTDRLRLGFDYSQLEIPLDYPVTVMDQRLLGGLLCYVPCLLRQYSRCESSLNATLEEAKRCWLCRAEYYLINRLTLQYFLIMTMHQQTITWSWSCCNFFHVFGKLVAVFLWHVSFRMWFCIDIHSCIFIA